MKNQHFLIATIFMLLAVTSPTIYAAETKSIEKMTAREYASTLTIADVILGEQSDGFWLRNVIRRACRFHSTEPYKHLYMELKSWSKEIDYLNLLRDTLELDRRVERSPTALKFSSSAEFEELVERLFPGFLSNNSGIYSVNFSSYDMKRACERRNFPYRPKDLPEYCWDDEIVYYVDEPDDCAYCVEYRDLIPGYGKSYNYNLGLGTVVKRYKPRDEGITNYNIGAEKKIDRGYSKADLEAEKEDRAWLEKQIEEWKKTNK